MTDDVQFKPVWAVVPIKDLSGAKRRLGSSLTESERRNLAHAMAQDVLGALLAAPHIDEILIVSNDREVLELAVRLNVHLIYESTEPGLSAAVAHGAQHVVSKGAKTMFVIHGDVPLASPQEIDDLLAIHVHGTEPAITLQPCSGNDGTNVLIATPPSVIPFHYGTASFSAHKVEAEKQGITPSVGMSQALALDIDTPDDLGQLLECLKHTEFAENTKLFLTWSGIADRFGGSE